MKKTLLITIFSLFAFWVKGQNLDSTQSLKNDSAKFIPVQVEPKYPGGMAKFLQYIEKNEKNHGDTGKVWITFVVEKDGSLTNIAVTKSLSASADKEAIKLLSECPKWIPGSAGGKPCRVRFTLPILFYTE